ncbi:MAG: hypothetical protein M1822_003798 [Bathelium mastoideum]|nr:MAG: hypothetical protein M1822_003798 [Bathelium mastoideum]
MLSSQVLGYPAPHVNSWASGEQPFEDGYVSGTLWNILHYLQELQPERDGDLVIVSSGYDSWFQLPPDVLIQRYHHINEEANMRIRKQMGRAVEAEGISQTIIFSADKRCRPNNKKELACYAVPESPVSQKIYDRRVDPKAAQSPEYLLGTTRPKYLKYGTVVGPVKEMRALYRQAGKKANAYGSKTDLQRIFNEIFGEQEYQRQVMTARHSRTKGLTAWIQSQRRMEKGFAPDPSYQIMDYYRGKPLEFGIGLDYSGLISSSSFGAEQDFAWLHFNSTSDARDAAEKIQVKPPRITSLPDDIRHARPPYFSFNAFGIDLPIGGNWYNVPLLTNVRTGVVPVILHENAGRVGKAGRRDRWWRSMWFQPYLQPLIDANILPSKRPLAVDMKHPRGDFIWFDDEVERRGGRDDDGTWVPWEDICRDANAKVF